MSAVTKEWAILTYLQRDSSRTATMVLQSTEYSLMHQPFPAAYALTNTA
jgi:hypothetical protein